MKIVTKLVNLIKKILKIPKKFLIPGVLIVLFLGNLLIPKNNTIPPQFAKVVKQDLKQEISASGILNGSENVALHFKSSGKLSYVNVKPGDTVYQGQVIAGLDTQDLASALRIAQSNFRDKKAAADKVHDDLNGVTSESFTQRQTRTTAEVAQDNAYDNLLIAQKAFNDSVIVSPIAGVITASDFVPGQIVSSSDTIAQVVDFSEIVFEAEIDESDISNISLGQKTEVTLNTYGDRIFKGQIIEIIPQTHTTNSGATVVTVKASIDDSNIEHISGLNGQINIITSEKLNVLSVPLDSVRNDNTVFIKVGSVIRPQKVSTGFKTDTDAEITDGLNEGDQVVVNQTEAVRGTINTFRFPFLRIGGGGGSFRSGTR